jgi:cation:H+ antiporter
MLEFAGMGLGATALILAIAAGVVWWAGYRLSEYGEVIAERTGLGGAFIGTVLIALLVSLPEMTFASVSAAYGQADLAVNSLLGGIAMTVVMLAIADFVVGPEPLSTDIEHPVVLLQGSLTVLMLTTVAAAILTGDRLLPGIGLAGMWTTALFALYVLDVLLMKYMERHHPWKTNDEPGERKARSRGGKRGKQGQHRGMSGAVVGPTLLLAGLVVAAGTVLAFGAEAMTQATGLGAGFIGLIFGGISTSLPELSTTISAARLKEYEMAFSDVFGTNLCSVGLLFVADLLYPGEPILSKAGTFSAVAVLVGAAVTAIYLAGMLVRPKQPILRMGPDSIAVLAVTAGGLTLLWHL